MKFSHNNSVSARQIKLKKGDKVITASHDIQTVESINSNGNVFTKESQYSWSPDNLMLYMRIKKTFQYDGIELKIVDKCETYMNATEYVYPTRVIAPNGGIIPVYLNHKQTLKSIIEDTTIRLESFKARGCDIQKELTSK